MVGNVSLTWVMASGGMSSPQSSLFVKERRLCLTTAFEAANICLVAPRVCAKTKSDTSPVSAADIAIQATVTRALREAFPGDVLVAEEDCEMVLSDPALTSAAQDLVEFDLTDAISNPKLRRGTHSNRCWTLDPIDGTKGFLSSRGYAVGLALLGKITEPDPTEYPSLAVLALPHDNTVFLAEPDKKCLQEFSLQTPLTRAIEDADLNAKNCGYSKTGAAHRGEIENFVWLLSGTEDLVLDGRPSWTFICCGSLVKYAAVARQQAVGFVQLLEEQRAHVWDHAAGIAVVMASGGNVTDEFGQRVMIGYGQGRQDLQLRGSARAIVATASGVNHASFCEEVRTALKAAMPT